MKIVVFHFFSWQLLTYIPSLGIMFALGGWFMGLALNKDSAVTVIRRRLGRLLPTFWLFSALTLIAGFFYAQGAGVELNPTLAWLFPYKQVTWDLDNAYANDATVVTWYIAAYMWFVFLSPLLYFLYKRAWFIVFLPVIAMPIYTWLWPTQETVLGETWFNLLTFGGCWMLGFLRADDRIKSIPMYLAIAVAAVCSLCSILLTLGTPALSDNPVALSVMSFGVAFLLLRINPSMDMLAGWVHSFIRYFSTFAVTIYLFHNILINGAFAVGDKVGLYGQWMDFGILIALLFVATKTLGIVETHKWSKA